MTLVCLHCAETCLPIFFAEEKGHKLEVKTWLPEVFMRLNKVKTYNIKG